MWDFNMGAALKMMARTLPFILLRLAVYLGIALGYMLVTGIGAGIGYGIGALGDAGFQSAAALWGGFIGFGLFGVAMYWAREYILYIVKAGHIAVLVELIDGKTLPPGKSQISHATSVVKQRFVEASVLFAADQLIKGVLSAISSLVGGMLALLPLPGVQQLSGILRAFLRVAIGFIDEVILAYAIRTESSDPWRSAKDALVLYGQNYKPMFINAAWLAAFIYGISILVFVLMLAPAAFIVYLMPGAFSAGVLIFALLLTWSIKTAVLEPFAIACMMQVYFKTIDGQQPNPEWEARLEQMSDKFRRLKDKITDSPQAPTGEAGRASAT